MKNRIITGVVAVCAFFVLVTPAFATTVVRTGDAVTIGDDQRVEGDFYTATNVSTIQGVVTGDVVGAVGSITLTGDIGEEVLLLAGTATLGETATVTDDVRIVGSDVVIAGNVSGSVFVLGNSLRILSTATIGGDVLFMGRTLTVEGDVTGDVLGQADEMRIDGLVGKSVNVTVTTLTLGDKAEVTDDVIYASPNELVRSINATVGGEITHTKPQFASADSGTLRTIAMSFLVVLFASLSVYLLVRRPLQVFGQYSAERPGLFILFGFAVLFLAPIVVVALLVSVLGLLLGMLGLGFVLLLILLALPLSVVATAGIISKLFDDKVTINTLTITLAVLVIHIAFVVPVIGTMVLLAILFLTIGALVHGSYRYLRSL